MPPAIRVHNLGKRYRISHEGQTHGKYRTLRDTLSDLAKAPLRRLRSGGETTGKEEDFWALKDISFDVQPGEVVGIIGRNGAGKSTLLKILSRITKPSTGSVELNGRVGSLLEVGTGFHPELTGRENIFLNGSILGMKRAEIQKQFDAIVDFSGVEKFLDTPVKRYSSGMHVRLAFSVAAHLQPEILIVDEVLAVGDAMFQRRCLDRMGQLAKSGVTVLLVSHNMQIIPQLCSNAVLLSKGQVADQGPAVSVTQSYMQHLFEETQMGDLRHKPRVGDGRAKYVSASLLDSSDKPTTHFVTGRNLRVQMAIEASEFVPRAELAVTIQNMHGTRLISSWTRETGFVSNLEPGLQSFECQLDAVGLRPGQTLLIHLWAASGGVLDFVENALLIDVTSDERHNHLSTNSDQGAVVYPATWRTVLQHSHKQVHNAGAKA